MMKYQNATNKMTQFVTVKFRGQSSRSKVTNNGTRHIVWRWSTYMPNMKSLSWTTKKLQTGHDLLRMHRPVWHWGQRSPTMVRNTSSGGGLPTCQIWKACLERQKSYSPDTICYGRTDQFDLEVKVQGQKNGMQHIVWRWSIYMPNMQSLSWTTKKL